MKNQGCYSYGETKRKESDKVDWRIAANQSQDRVRERY